MSYKIEICPICEKRKLNNIIDSDNDNKENYNIKICFSCREKIIQKNKLSENNKICCVCGKKFKTEDNWRNICDDCQQIILNENQKREIYVNYKGERFYIRRKMEETKGIWCIDCHKRVFFIHSCDTKTCRCEECSKLRKRKMNRVRKQRQREKQKMSR